MTPQDKQDVDMFLSTATLASFAIPGAGAVIAGGIGIGQLLFDIYDEPKIDPTKLPATKGDLTQAISDFAVKVDDALWEQDIAKMRAAVVSINSLFLLYWDAISHVGLDKLVVGESTPGAADGGTFFDDNADSSLVNGTTTYFGSNSTNTYLALSTAFGILSDPGDVTSQTLDTIRRRTQHTPVYCLIASTWISYMKAAVIWDWNHNHIIARQEYEHWQVLSDQFKQKGIGKDPGAWPANDIPTIPDWNTYRLNGLPVKFLLSVVDQVLLDAEGDGTVNNPGLFTTMVQNAFTDRLKLLAERLSKLSIQTDGTWYWYLDTDTAKGGKSPIVASRELAELHMKGKSGALIAFWWDYYTQNYGLDGLDLQCLTAFSQAIKLWNAAGASVSFWSYTVQKGDDLSSIVANFSTDPLAANPIPMYDSPLYDKAIFDANSKILTPGPRSYAPWQGVALTPGQILMLPDKEAADFTIYTITAADRYPYTICEKFFGDRLLRDPLDDANAGRHYPMNEFTFGAGTDIRVPNLYWAYPAPTYAPTSQYWATNQIDPVTKVPYYPIRLPNGQVIDSQNWVTGFRVRYAFSFYIQASDTMIEAMETHRGPWTDWLHSDSYFHPILENLPWDATKQATSRRIYRQFHDEDARVELVGEIQGNDPAAPPSWPDTTP